MFNGSVPAEQDQIHLIKFQFQTHQSCLIISCRCFEVFGHPWSKPLRQPTMVPRDQVTTNLIKNDDFATNRRSVTLTETGLGSLKSSPTWSNGPMMTVVSLTKTT